MNIEYAEITAAITTDCPINRSVTGYGARIPTQYKVQIEGNTRWLRVYCICYSNAGSLFIDTKSTGRRFIRDYEIEIAL